MNNTELNCCKCGKEFGFTERIYTCGDLWQCEDCAIKKMQENDNKDKTIADLEAKLAESEKNVEFYQERYSNATTSAYGADLIAKNIQSRLEEEIRELKQQLAEKEKENDFLKLQTKEFLEKGMLIVRQQDLWAIDEKHNQDKISFAVEQLEKVEETFTWGKDNGYLTPENAVNIIDNQIKQLKEGK